MKKFLVMALAVFSLVSCSKSDSSDGQQEVSFDKFVGTWTGTREAFLEDGSVFVLEDCQKNIIVEFKKVQSENGVINYISYRDTCSDPDSMGFIISSVTNNTLIDKTSEKPVFSYTFENNNLLKVETTNGLPYFNQEAFQAEIDKIEATGNTPTANQIAELTKKYTHLIKFKTSLNRQ